MARILAYTTPGRGHLYPLIPILGELRRGHQVVLRTLAAEVASMRQRGFDAGPISDRIEAIAHDDWRAPSPRAALGRAKVHEAIQLREGARRIQHVFATAGGPSAAADAFETHLLHREPPQKLPSRQDQASSAGSEGSAAAGGSPSDPRRRAATARPGARIGCRGCPSGRRSRWRRRSGSCAAR